MDLLHRVSSNLNLLFLLAVRNCFLQQGLVLPLPLDSSLVNTCHLLLQGYSQLFLLGQWLRNLLNCFPEPFGWLIWLGGRGVDRNVGFFEGGGGTRIIASASALQSCFCFGTALFGFKWASEHICNDVNGDLDNKFIDNLLVSISDIISNLVLNLGEDLHAFGPF